MFRLPSLSRPQKNEIPQWLAFLSAATKREMMSFATPSSYLYDDYSTEGNEYNYESLSLLEIASYEGKLLHVKIYLADMNPSQEDVLKSFFRALEAQNSDVALLLLKHGNTSDLVATIKLIRTNDPCGTENQAHYLEKIKKSNHYVFRYNPHVIQGNIALILSAALPDPTLFQQLLTHHKIAEQLDDSGLAAFLSATLNADGSAKKDVNKEIIFNLLDIPAIYKYAHARSFDFGHLLNLKRQYTRQEESICQTNSALSLTSLGGLSSRTTSVADFSRPPSVMGTLFGARSGVVTSVMSDPYDLDRPCTPCTPSF